MVLCLYFIKLGLNFNLFSPEQIRMSCRHFVKNLIKYLLKLPLT